ncbi:hypothetical protein ZOSMA_9G00390 [Zostera marina]|uniref:Uncharacterized protein n=1 Tax=Zostera marina TaxID=29655 RepID=A0A0K9NGP8_ZOSMR|nr:hypothetical protein ZOSMA_9G00390 [Zostera marina]
MESFPHSRNSKAITVGMIDGFRGNDRGFRGTAVRVYLSPPYVFLAVKCIIVVIWFLSKQTNYKLQQQSDTTGKSKKLPDDQTPIFSQIQFQYSIPKLSKTPSQSQSSYLTSAASYLEGDIMRKSRGPSTGYFNPTPISGREDEIIDGFDATWKSIMVKKKNDATWNVLPEVEELRSSLTITRNPMGFGNDTRREPLELKTDEEIEAFINKTKERSWELDFGSVGTHQWVPCCEIKSRRFWNRAYRSSGIEFRRFRGNDRVPWNSSRKKKNERPRI